MNMTTSTRFVGGSAALIGIVLGMAGIFLGLNPVLAQEKSDDDLPPRFLFDGALFQEDLPSERRPARLVLSKRKDLKEVLRQFVGNWRLVSFEFFGQNGEHFLFGVLA